ncbi:MAG: hypothetical protein AAF799_24650 [Myxococcota bacterium]
MTTKRHALTLSLLVLAAPLSACDAETPTDVDYRAIGHVDLAEVKKAPWMEKAMLDAKLDDKGELGACGDVLRQAESVTFGVGEDTFEAYIKGPIAANTANACSEFIDAKVAEETAKGDHDDHPTPEATLVADGVFAVFGGNLTPSTARLRQLEGSAPVSGKPAWFTATIDEKDSPVSHVEAWANFDKGLDAHVEAQFKDPAKAAELYGQATLGLVALRASGEMGELASVVDLDSDGDTITAEVHATPKQMEAFKAMSEKRRGHHGHPHARKGSSVQFQVGDAPDGDEKQGFEIHIGSGD